MGWGGAPVERSALREELVEHDAEGEHVGRRRGLGLPPRPGRQRLLGRGIGWRHRSEPVPGRPLPCPAPTRRVPPVCEGLRDAEVEEVDPVRPVGGLRGEDVRRLDVAVDDELSVGVADGVAEQGEQLDALYGAEPVRSGEVGDRTAPHVLHREAGTPVLRGPRAQESRNRGVLESCELALLALEPRRCAGGLRGQHLYRRLLAGLRVVGEVHLAHPAPAHPPTDHEPPGPSADQLALRSSFQVELSVGAAILIG